MDALLLRGSGHRAIRYLPGLLIGIGVALWNIAVVTEGGDDGVVLALIGAEGLIPLISAALLGSAWRAAHTSESNDAQA